MIQHASFAHGWFYHYRVHLPRSQTLLTDFPELHTFLGKMFSECPHDKFLSGPRCSKLRFTVPVSLVEIEGHEICTLAAMSLEHGTAKTAHTNVEVGLLQADPSTVSVEVPLWMDSHELEGYETVFESSEPVTGHIDILRVEGNTVWIWDFKPNAHKEKWAATQLNTYATMLSIRTGVPLESIKCGYFDEARAYVFEPVPMAR